VTERRSHPRVSRSFEATFIEPNTGFENQSGLRRAVRVSGLSLGGCCITEFATAQPRSRCRLLLSLPGEGVAAVDAEVVYAAPDSGCGVRFLQPTEHAAGAIARTVTASLV
jgi:hypothetical protein